MKEKKERDLMLTSADATVYIDDIVSCYNVLVLKLMLNIWLVMQSMKKKQAFLVLCEHY